MASETTMLHWNSGSTPGFEMVCFFPSRTVCHRPWAIYVFACHNIITSLFRIFNFAYVRTHVLDVLKYSTVSCVTEAAFRKRGVRYRVIRYNDRASGFVSGEFGLRWAFAITVFIIGEFGLRRAFAVTRLVKIRRAFVTGVNCQNVCRQKSRPGIETYYQICKGSVITTLPHISS